MIGKTDEKTGTATKADGAKGETFYGTVSSTVAAEKAPLATANNSHNLAEDQSFAKFKINVSLRPEENVK